MLERAMLKKAAAMYSSRTNATERTGAGCSAHLRRRRRVRDRPWPGLALAACCAVLTCAAPASASGKVRIVATTPGLADITRNVGGEHVSVDALMRGPENIHNVKPKPSFVVKVKRADLFVHTGLDIELWATQLVKSARNKNLLPGHPGDVDVSRGIQLKEVPQRGQLSRALGDIHVYGNPHFALDPLNGVIIARNIADALKRVDPAHADDYQKNYEAYAQKLRDLTARLVEKMRPYQGVKVVVYHRTWPYFRDRFGLVKVGEVEPKPGISPGPQHLSQCIATMQSEDAKIVIVETYNSKKNAQFIADRIGGQAVVLAQEVLAVPEADSYEKMFEYNVDALIEAFRAAGVEPGKSAAATGGAAAAP
ncbi:MAG: zinc ABC transporter substrate-binding protein [Planctomycetota bacterium]|nr:MAG: zinc ABC transporter substrate-binding protein [Planctomycetota bacterium]